MSRLIDAEKIDFNEVFVGQNVLYVERSLHTEISQIFAKNVEQI